MPDRSGRRPPAPVAAADRLPPWAPGLKIGLFGGSFDPPHAGHLMVSRLVRRRLKLDQVWWLVSPHNPLKPDAPSHDLDRRIAAAEAAITDPAVKVTGIEAALGTTYTVDLIAWLSRRLTGVRLVWVMGADNLGQFHRWQDWRRIAATVPIAVVDRPGEGPAALASPAAQALRRYRLKEAAAALLADRKPPAWVYLHGPQIPVSSTVLRQRRSTGPAKVS